MTMIPVLRRFASACLTLCIAVALCAALAKSAQANSVGPVVVVKNQANVSLLAGGTDILGTLTVGQTKTVTYTIINAGTADLSLAAASLDGGLNVSGIVVAGPTTTLLAPLGSTTFTVTFKVDSAAPFNVMLHFNNNDPARSPFTIIIAGTAVNPVPPAITALFSPTNVLVGNASNLVLTLTNSNPVVLTGVSVASTTLPPGLTGNNPATTCGAGTVTYNSGANTLSLSGGALSANSSCTVNLTVIPTAAGIFSLTTNSVSATQTGPGGVATTPNLVAAQPGSIAISTGTGQSAQVNAAFAQPLAVLVKDTFGDPIGGVSVTFATPPSSGPSAVLSATTALTNASGVASVTATANGNVGGPYPVTASVTGVALPASIFLSNLPASQTITFTSTPPSPALVGGAPYTVAATATSGLPVSFSIAPASASVCSISGAQVSFTMEGTCVINADQPGDANHAAATTVQQSITVVDTITPQAEAVGGYMSDRANQIVTNQFDASRQIDRLQQAGQQQGDGGNSQFAANGTQAALADGELASSFPRPGLADPLDIFGLHAAGETSRTSAAVEHLQYSGLFDLDVDVSDGFEGTFKASLNHVLAWNERQQAALGLGQGSSGVTTLPFDLWVEGVYANYEGDRDGRFGMITVGADYVFGPGFLAGFYAQYDNTEETSTAHLSGEGWMIGPYATARLGENVFWQGRAAWGQSSNEIVTASSGAFDTTRWLVSSELSGRWQFANGVTFSPAASFTWFEDKSDSYVDSNSITVPSVTSRLGQLKLAPQLSYGFTTADGLWIEPSISPELLWNFASSRADGLGTLDADAAGPDGVRGRIKAGVTVRAGNGLTVTATGSYDGIGVGDDYHAITGRLGLAFPF